VDSNRQIFDAPLGKSKTILFDGRPLLGFGHVVATIIKNEGPRDTLSEKKNPTGVYSPTVGGRRCRPEVAPLLSDLLRQILEGEHKQNSSIDDF
jgi:hypothetical protein